MSFRRMLAQLERCREVARRETTLWTIRFMRMALDDLAEIETKVRTGTAYETMAAAVAEAARFTRRIEESLETLRKEDDYAGLWRLEREDESFVATVGRLAAFQAALLGEVGAGKV